MGTLSDSDMKRESDEEIFIKHWVFPRLYKKILKRIGDSECGINPKSWKDTFDWIVEFIQKGVWMVMGFEWMDWGFKGDKEIRRGVFMYSFWCFWVAYYHIIISYHIISYDTLFNIYFFTMQSLNCFRRILIWYYIY